MKIVGCLLFLCFSQFTWAQGLFRLTADKPQSFKFELINNAVLIPITINGVEFSFLLDTGVKETILFAQTHDSLYLRNQNKMRFYGIGIEDGIDGILSTDNVMKVGNIAVDSLHSIYVIQAYELDISSNIGVSVNGILGSKFFNSFAVQIDYERTRITLYPPGYDYAKAVKGYEMIPIDIENERPYVQAKTQMRSGWIEGKMLVDMGNTDPMMLFSFLLPDFRVEDPCVEEYIGRGFNGAIYGKRNRVRKLALKDFELDYPIVSYPDSTAVFMSKLAENRIGSIGNQTLQRFHVLIDYEATEMYLKKNRRFRKPFALNMAGIDIKHDGMIWIEERVKVKKPQKESTGLVGQDQGVTIDFSNDHFQYRFVLKPSYRVSGIRKNSPAELAGVKVGDELVKINGTTAGNLSLSKIMSKLQSHPGDEVRLSLQRGEEIKQVRFRLVDPIPYL